MGIAGTAHRVPQPLPIYSISTSSYLFQIFIICLTLSNSKNIIIHNTSLVGLSELIHIVFKQFQRIYQLQATSPKNNAPEEQKISEQQLESSVYIEEDQKAIKQ